MTATTLVERVRQQLVMRAMDPTPARVASVLRDDGVVLGDDAILAMVQTLRDEIAGAGPLEMWLRTPGVTDVLVNGPDEIWIDRGNGLERVPASFTDDSEVRRLAQRLAASAGRRLDDASPYVDARMVDGTRLHAVIPPIARDGTTISLRVPRRREFSVDELVALGTFDEAMAEVIVEIVVSRMSFLISGGTGSGKTTILSALLGRCDPIERLVIVEDSTELLPAHPHVVRLESRPANSEGVGGVGLRDLVRQSLRMRPDRVIVGEVRGAEVLDLMMALNTGHEGCCGTVHANSAGDVPSRLRALGMMTGVGADAMHSLIAAGLDAVIHVRRHGALRRVESIAMLVDGACVEAMSHAGGRTTFGPAYELLCERLGRSPAPRVA